MSRAEKVICDFVFSVLFLFFLKQPFVYEMAQENGRGKNGNRIFSSTQVDKQRRQAILRREPRRSRARINERLP